MSATTTTTPVPVNLSQNIVTIVLIIGVAVVVTLLFALVKLIPKIRRGEVSFSKIEFDWRAELLNQTPKKEKLRRAEEKARRDEERAAAAAARYEDADEAGAGNGSETQPRVEMNGKDEPMGEVYSGRRAREEEDAQVTFPREQRE